MFEYGNRSRKFEEKLTIYKLQYPKKKNAKYIV